MADVSMILRNMIADAIYKGQSGDSIAELSCDGLPQNNYTMINPTLLRIHVNNALKHPKNYTNPVRSENDIRTELRNYANKIEKDPMGEVITAEFWMWEDFAEYEYIAQVCKIVADTILAIGGKRR